MFSRSKIGGRHLKMVPVVLFLAFSLASLVESAPSLPEVELLQKEENIVQKTSEHEAESSRRGTATAERVHAKIM